MRNMITDLLILTWCAQHASNSFELVKFKSIESIINSAVGTNKKIWILLDTMYVLVDATYHTINTYHGVMIRNVALVIVKEACGTERTDQHSGVGQ